MHSSLRDQEEKKDKVLYLVTNNFASPHIQALCDECEKNLIVVQIQRETDTLGLKMNRRYFVVVDNRKGQVVLGPQFSSLLMFIVGYPRKGFNKKNHYCQTVSQVIEKFKYYCLLPQFSKPIFETSALKSKSKSKISASSQKIRSFTNTDSVQSINLPQPKNEKAGPNMFSKVFFLLSESNAFYNKICTKISASDRIKYKISENIDDLSLWLSVCKTKHNYLFAHSEHLEDVLKENLEGLKILVYEEKKIERMLVENKYKDKEKFGLMDFCENQNEIVRCMRNLGFPVVSLKDIEKSIVRYDNPRARQQYFTKNQSKHLNWASTRHYSLNEGNVNPLPSNNISICQTEKQINEENTNIRNPPIKEDKKPNQQSFTRTPQELQIESKGSLQEESRQCKDKNNDKNKNKNKTMKKRKTAFPRGPLISNQHQDQDQEHLDIKEKIRKVKRIKRFQSEYQQNSKQKSEVPINEIIEKQEDREKQSGKSEKERRTVKVKRIKRKLLLPASQISSSSKQSCIFRKIYRTKSLEPEFYRVKQLHQTPISPASEVQEKKVCKIQRQLNRNLRKMSVGCDCPLPLEDSCKKQKFQWQADTMESDKRLKRISSQFQATKEILYNTSQSDYFTTFGHSSNFQNLKTISRLGIHSNSFQDTKFDYGFDFCSNNVFSILWKDFNDGITSCRSYLSERVNIPDKYDISFYSVHEFSVRLESLMQPNENAPGIVLFLDDVGLEVILGIVISQKDYERRIKQIYVTPKKMIGLTMFMNHVAKVTISFEGRIRQNLIKPIFLNQYIDEDKIFEKAFAPILLRQVKT